MRKQKRIGFTLVEVSLFLAVSALLFASIAIGTQNAMKRQRFNDSVQNFADFLRSVYAQVSNPQGIGDGRTGKAIYGKLITFGQTHNLKGASISGQEIFAYDVVANAKIEGTGSLQELLKNNGVSLVVEKGSSLDFAGFYESYTPNWGALIENKKGNKYTGSILILRHPRSGTVTTLVYNSEVLEVNKLMTEYRNGNNQDIRDLLTKYINKFETAQLDFCLNPDGTTTSQRRDVRLVEGARNASGVEIIDLDSSANICADRS